MMADHCSRPSCTVTASRLTSSHCAAVGYSERKKAEKAKLKEDKKQKGSKKGSKKAD